MNDKVHSGMSDGGIAIATSDEGEFVAHVKNFVTNKGRRIEQHIVALGVRPAAAFEFYGYADATVQPSPACPVGAKCEFRFPLEGVTTLKQAVEQFDLLANAFAQKSVIPQMKAQLAQQARAAGHGIQVVQPGQTPPPNGGIPPHNRLTGL